MPQNTTLTPLTPNQKAAIGTGLVVILLAAFTFVGFWYGKNHTNDEQNTTTNPTTKVDSTTETATGEQSLPAKITKVLENSLEIQTGSGDAVRTVVAKIKSSTVLRKLDFRSTTTSSNGGVAVKLADLKSGNFVVVVSDDITGNIVEANKIILFIYP